MRLSFSFIASAFAVLINASPVQETGLNDRTANETLSKRTVGGV